jgi:hypothetical protein
LINLVVQELDTLLKLIEICLKDNHKLIVIISKLKKLRDFYLILIIKDGYEESRKGYFCKICANIHDQYCVKCENYFCNECLEDFHNLFNKLDHLIDCIPNNKKPNDETMFLLNKYFEEFFK